MTELRSTQGNRFFSAKTAASSFALLVRDRDTWTFPNRSRPTGWDQRSNILLDGRLERELRMTWQFSRSKRLDSNFEPNLLRIITLFYFFSFSLITFDTHSPHPFPFLQLCNTLKAYLSPFFLISGLLRIQPQGSGNKDIITVCIIRTKYAVYRWPMTLNGNTRAHRNRQSGD